MGYVKSGLARKGAANTIRKYMKMTPKEYRKTLVGLTNVVETSMCSKEWENINYSKLPSLHHLDIKKHFTEMTGKDIVST